MSPEQTKEELYEQAQKEGVEGRSTMSKEELAEAVDAPTEPTEEEKFREEQKIAAANQNQTAENAVPAQPPAFDRIEDYHQSPTYLAMKEQGVEPTSQPPMGKEAYDRAGSDSQAKKAEKESRTPVIPPAAHVVIRSNRDETKPFDGKPGAIQRVNFVDLNSEITSHLGTPEAEYHQVESYIVRTRDARNDIVEVHPDEIEVVQPHEFFRGGP